MARKEQLQTKIGLGAIGQHANNPADTKVARKAAQLVRTPRTNITARYTRLTSRVLPEQFEWVRNQSYTYTMTRSNRPRLTMDELIRMLIDLGQQLTEKELNQRIEEYRNK